MTYIKCWLLVITLVISVFSFTQGVQPPGSGTGGDPYLVSSVDHLEWISLNSSSWDKVFKQTADIDASGTSSWNGGEGFSPIGNSSTSFTGSYDGQEYSINGLYIYRSTDNIGFFGMTENAGISNMRLNNVDITGNEMVGALAGLSSYNTIITNCFVEGEVSGNKYAGGFAGKADYNEIYRSYAECVVVSNDVGAGFLGYNNRTKVYECYSKGNVNGAGSGGFSGLCIFGESYNSLSMSDVAGDYSGGFNASSTYGYFENCYSSGTVNGSSCGGFNSYKYHGGFMNCFWDEQTSGQSSSAGGDAKSTTEMKTLSTFNSAGWDFIGETTNGTNDYWSIDGATNNGYPFLSWQCASWTGGAGTNDWFTAGNWYSSELPAAGDDVSIANTSYMPVVAGTSVAECNDLHIGTTATVTIEDNGKLTVNGDVTNNGTIQMESNSYGDASLIVKGVMNAASGSFYMDRHISGNSLGWHFLSSPVNAYNISGSTIEPGVNEGLFAWDESANDYPWINYKNTISPPTFSSINGGDLLNPGQGYLVAYEGTNVTKTFSGKLNTGDVNFLLKNSSTKAWTYQEGWNFMGNPYSSSLDWNLADRSLFQDDYAYIYHPNKPGGEGYIEVNGASPGAYIGPNQGFFVIAKQASNNTNFTFNTPMQIHGGEFLKNTTADDHILLRLSGNTYYDETRIIVDPQGSPERNRLDAVKMYSFSDDVPQICSKSEDNVELSINNIPEINALSRINLGILIPKQGNYSISLEEASSAVSSSGIFLEDKLMQQWHRISETPYDFSSPEGEVPSRFVLHFAAQDVEEIDGEKNVRVFTSNNAIHVLNPDLLRGEVNVFNVYGQLQSNFRLNGSSEQQVSMKVSSGYYIVQIVTDYSVISRKVFLK